jgi:phosphate transport system substrate-binding protein
MNISAVHRSDESGTTDNFTSWLEAAGQGAWSKPHDGVWPFKGGEGAQGTSGVIDAVTNGKGTIGYADLSQAKDLSIAKVKVGSSYVAPTAAGAAKAVELSKPVSGRAAGDYAVDVNRTTTDSSAYPVVLVSYLIGCPSYKDQKTADLVKNYFNYVISPAGQKAAASTAGSAPLTSSLSAKAKSIVSEISAKS